jgi:hypothetical protein
MHGITHFIITVGIISFTLLILLFRIYMFVLLKHLFSLGNDLFPFLPLGITTVRSQKCEL